MDIGEIEKVRRIELPQRREAPAQPQRQPIPRKEPAPERTPERTPEKVPAGPEREGSR
jgi:hypothetical protein